MSRSFKEGRWEVRWRDSSGSQRSKRFHQEEAAREFDEMVHTEPQEGRDTSQNRAVREGGVYPYQTTSGMRWRYVARRSDGRMTSKRGFQSATAARKARRQFVESIDRGEVRHSRETFGTWWTSWLERRKPYLEAGSWQAYEINGRRRLLPLLADVPLERFERAHVERLADALAESVEAGELAAKTANNALVTLVVCLNAAVKAKLMPSNPAAEIERFPDAHIERDYLRLDEIDRYLDACSAIYRTLAATLIGSGVRISEALALRVHDLELEESGGFIRVYRSRKSGAEGSTKSNKFRGVEIGPRLAVTLLTHLEESRERMSGDRDAYLFVMPQRIRKSDRGRWRPSESDQPMDRTTVSRDWHKAALQDAGLRDMPLHALRHTAAAAWLAAGNPLVYVQRQLGHGSITTTEHYYGHLERRVLAVGAGAAEAAIARAGERLAQKP